MAENFPRLMTDTRPQIQDLERQYQQGKYPQNTPTHIMFKHRKLRQREVKQLAQGCRSDKGKPGKEESVIPESEHLTT